MLELKAAELEGSAALVRIVIYSGKLTIRYAVISFTENISVKVPC
jgi:hypothetical protein